MKVKTKYRYYWILVLENNIISDCTLQTSSIADLTNE